MDAALNYNGFVVTGAESQVKGWRDCAYRGVAYGDAWLLDRLDRTTLDSETLDMSEAVLQVLMQQGLPQVLMDPGTADSYAACCSRIGIEVRVILVATTAEYPVLADATVQSVVSHSTFLGYDYWDGGNLSILHSDMCVEPVTELLGYAGLLNSFGLFAKLSDLHHYAHSRERLLEDLVSEYPKEQIVVDRPFWNGFSMWPTGVWEVRGSLTNANPWNHASRRTRPICGR